MSHVGLSETPFSVQKQHFSMPMAIQSYLGTGFVYSYFVRDAGRVRPRKRKIVRPAIIFARIFRPTHTLNPGSEPHSPQPASSRCRLFFCAKKTADKGHPARRVGESVSISAHPPLRGTTIRNTCSSSVTCADDQAKVTPTPHFFPRRDTLWSLASASPPSFLSFI